MAGVARQARNGQKVSRKSDPGSRRRAAGSLRDGQINVARQWGWLQARCRAGRELCAAAVAVVVVTLAGIVGVMVVVGVAA